MKIAIYNYGLEINYRKTKTFQGKVMPWCIQIMKKTPYSCKSILWINDNPFRRIRASWTDTKKVPCIPVTTLFERVN